MLEQSEEQPGTITIMTVTTTDSTQPILVGWTGPTNVDGYRISILFSDVQENLPGDASDYTIPAGSLDPGIEYDFYVEATNVTVAAAGDDPDWMVSAISTSYGSFTTDP